MAGRTAITRAFATSPLKLLRPRNHGSAAWVYAATYGGGLVGGDAIQLDIDIGPRAAALVTTQASTKVYRSPAGAAQEVTARIDADGLLVLAPDPIVCFAASSYTQSQIVHLDTTGTLVLIDALSAGRIAHGERWALDEYRSTIRVQRARQLVIYDAVRLSAADDSLLARFGRFNVLLSVILLGPKVGLAAGDIVTQAAGIPVERRADTVFTAAPIEPDGALLRVASVSLEAAWRMLRTELAFLTPLLGDDPWARKW